MARVRFLRVASVSPWTRAVAARKASPALINRGYGRTFFWDGRSSSLEEQVLQPMQDPNEMGLTMAEAAARVKLDEATIAAPWRVMSALSDPAGRGS